MRLAWFSPVPPVRSGIAGRSAELVGALRNRGHRIDIYVDSQPSAVGLDGVSSAHDFPWRHRGQPYDLAVYQFGNSSHHDYTWPYAFRYPGLVVLHDTRLHHARAALLLREKRVDDYRAELAANHPDLDPDVTEVAIAGFDSALYYTWPMARLLVGASRLAAVHGAGTARDLANTMPELADRIVSIRLGEGEPLTPSREMDARRRIRARYGIADEAIVFACLGGLTPEKRITQILDAMPAVAAASPSAHLLLAGAPAAHYDVAAEIAARALQDRVTTTGYVESDEALTDHLAACDVSLNLRWPTARETSGPWLRALAAGRPTIVTDLAHLTGIPSLDPRTWRQQSLVDGRGSLVDHPISVAIDILDEDHSLRLAMRRLAADAELRAAIGRAAYEYWRREHSLEAMVDDYERVIADAASRPAPRAELPAHIRDSGAARLRSLTAPFGVTAALSREGFLE